MVSSVELVIAGCGALLLITALMWRSRAGRQQRRTISRALVDTDAETRKAALLMVAEQGLGPYLQLLVERSRQETHEPVLDSLMEVVLRNQWEPSDNRRVVELRLWAEARRARAAADQLAVTTARATQFTDDLGRPRPVANGSRSRPFDNDSAGIEVDLEELIRNEESWSSSGRAESSLASNGNGTGVERASSAVLLRSNPDGERQPQARRVSARSAPRRSPAPTAIVTGAGGAAGVAVIRGLQALGHPVVGVDSDGLAAGLRLAEEAALVPRSDDPTFIDALCEITTTIDAQLLIPTLTEELVALAGAEALFTARGVASWLPSPAAVEVCKDKWQFAGLLEDNGIAGPATNLGSADRVPGAWVVKPRFGRGSRDVHFVDRIADLRWVLPRVPEPIVQTRLTGREFTVDALVDRDGTLAGAVPRWRLETKAGISTKGKTFADSDLVRAVGALLAVAGLTGPANVQGCMASDGTPWFIEVNPRFSGGLPLSLASGADLLGEYVRGIQGEPIRPENLQFRPGMTMIRHFDEIFE